MVAPVGRRQVQQQPKTETPPKSETTPPQQPVSTEGQELVQLLQKLGQQLATAWTAATKEPGGDPVVKFLRAFTGGDASTTAVQQENQTKMAERQAKAKDAMGFSVSEPEPPKKTEAPKEEPKVAEGRVAPDASFSQTKARIGHAKADFQATKAEAGALLYSLAQELKLAKAAGQSKEEISANVQLLLGNFRTGTSLAPDLVAIGDALGVQIQAISLMGDSPAAYEALALSLLGGKVPEAPEPFIEAHQMTLAESFAAAEARGEGGGGGEGGGIPIGEIGVAGQRSYPQATAKGTSEPKTNVKVTYDQGGQQVTEQRRRQEQQRLERQRRENERRDDSGGGGGTSTRVVEEQIKTTQLNDQLNRTNLDRDLQNRRIEEEQINRRRN